MIKSIFMMTFNYINYIKILNLIVGTSIVLVSCKGKMTDDVIKKNVDSQLSLLQDSATISSVVNNGIVTLAGKCEGADCPTIIRNAVVDVEGVDSIINNIVMASPIDLTLRTSVLTVVARYEGIQADVVNGIVVLRGSIAKKRLKPLIDELSLLMPKRIDNQLAIK